MMRIASNIVLWHHYIRASTVCPLHGKTLTENCMTCQVSYMEKKLVKTRNVTCCHSATINRAVCFLGTLQDSVTKLVVLKKEICMRSKHNSAIDYENAKFERIKDKYGS